MIMAVLEQHCRVPLHSYDVFASTVGGARLQEPACDLAIAVALASAATGVATPSGVVALGEISLAGEVRKVRDLPQRLAEAARLGFRIAVAPVTDRGARPVRRELDGMTVLEVADLPSALAGLELTGARHRSRFDRYDEGA
jgi:DNA repair protein RadA/Sms